MPRGRGRATATNDQQENTMSDSQPQFSFNVTAAPEDYEPPRRTPGRDRTPSFFDHYVVDLKDAGWQRTDYATEEERKAIIRELNRARDHANSNGHSIGVDIYNPEGASHVEWRSREKQYRPRRNRNGSEALAAAQTEVVDGDPDE